MNTHCFDFSICKSFVVVATLAALGFASTPASARSFPIKPVTFSNLAKACAAAHGNMYSTAGGGYACATGCKGSGNDNTCSVECDGKGNCTGTTPGRTYPGGSALQVLLTGSSGVAANPGSPPPAKSGGLLGDGILGTGPGLGTGGPSATGSPGSAGGAPAAVPIQLR